jgi:hypothetical protein
MWATPDGSNYGCAYPGGGGIMCDKDTGCLESDGQADRGAGTGDAVGTGRLAGAHRIARADRPQPQSPGAGALSEHPISYEHAPRLDRAGLDELKLDAAA